MPRFNLTLILALATSALAVPLQKSTSEPFKIVVATPTLPTFAPWYLTSEGTVTSTKEDAALCYMANERLFCDSDPIGAPKNVGTAPFKPSKDPDAVTAIITINKDNQITWLYSGLGLLPPGTFEPAVMKSATFWLKLDSTQGVWALFGGPQTTNSVEANLLVEFQ